MEISSRGNWNIASMALSLKPVKLRVCGTLSYLRSEHLFNEGDFIFPGDPKVITLLGPRIHPIYGRFCGKNGKSLLEVVKAKI